VTAVFWAAILCCTMNLILILLVIPESLHEAGQRAAQNGDSPVVLNKPTLKKRLLGPLAMFAPRKRLINGRLQKDWSMSWLATAMFALLLASVRNLSTAFEDNLTFVSGRVSSRSNFSTRVMSLVGLQKRHVCLVSL
jgi:hypothetical protein